MEKVDNSESLKCEVSFASYTLVIEGVNVFEAGHEVKYDKTVQYTSVMNANGLEVPLTLSRRQLISARHEA